MQILFVTSTRIGDAVLSTGLLSHLISRYPDARITVACGTLPAPLFASAPGVVRVIPLTKQALAGHWLSLWVQTVATMWDLVVDLRGSALAWLLPTRRRRVIQPRADANSVHRVTELAALLGVDPPPAPRLWISREDAGAAADLLPAGVPVLGLGATANWRPKIWPAEHFAALADRLTRPGGILAGGRVAVFGGPDEREIAAPLLDALPADRCVDLVGRHGLGLTAACLARCSLFVGNDSGLMHIAAAAGTPTVGLFGPSPPARYGPWGTHCAVAASSETYETIVGAETFDHRRDDNLMLGLSVDTVEETVSGLWQGLSGTGARSADAARARPGAV